MNCLVRRLGFELWTDLTVPTLVPEPDRADRNALVDPPVVKDPSEYRLEAPLFLRRKALVWENGFVNPPNLVHGRHVQSTEQELDVGQVRVATGLRLHCQHVTQ